MIDENNRKLTPIQFTELQVRGLLLGATQVRKVVNPQPVSSVNEVVSVKGVPFTWEWRAPGHASTRSPCPYGAQGSLLWVRERWWHEKLQGGAERAAFDDGTLIEQGGKAHRIPDWRPQEPTWRERGRQHMPSWAARYRVEVKSVRVQRIHDTSIEDMLSEGILSPQFTIFGMSGLSSQYHMEEAFLRNRYAAQWSLDHGKHYPWSRNPWVWAVEYTRVATPSDHIWV